MSLLKSYIFEVLRKSDQTMGGAKDNLDFVEDAFYKKGYMTSFLNLEWVESKKKHEGEEFVIRECTTSGENLITVFMMSGEKPVGYVALHWFEDGVKIGTLAVGMEYRRGASKKIYGFIVNEFGKLYSDDNQTPQARGLWNSLFKSREFKIYAVDTLDGMKKYDLKSMEDLEKIRLGDLSSKELGLAVSHDDGLHLYSDEDTFAGKRMLLCFEK